MAVPSSPSSVRTNRFAASSPVKSDAITLLRPQTLHRTAGDTVFFGAGGSNDWTKDAKEPSITIPELPKCEREGSSEGLTVYWQTWQNNRKLTKEKNKAQSLLPKKIQAQLRSYHWSFGYWWDRAFNPANAKLMSVVYSGPAAIKAKQTDVEEFNATTKKVFQELLEELDDPERREQTRKKTCEKSAILGFLFPIAVPIVKYILHQPIKEYQVYERLLSDVPPLPKEQFKADLEALKTEYAKNNPGDKIKKVGNSIASGSIGQVFWAETNSGKQVILKVVKPDVTVELLNEYKPYFYFLELIKTGKDEQAKKKAVQEAESTVETLIRESRLKEEADNTGKIRQSVRDLGIQSFDIPEVLASTQRGAVFTKVGDMDLIKATTKQEEAFLAKTGLDLCRLLFLESAKPLDLHRGNIRISKDGSTEIPYLIDHGRQANLDPNFHQKLLSLMAAVYAELNFSPEKIYRPNHDSAIIFSYGLQDWLSLLSKDDIKLKFTALLNASNKVALASKLQNITPTSPLKDKEELAIALAGFLGYRYKKGYIVGTPSVLNLWSHSIQTGNTKQLSENDLSAQDLNTYRKKMSSFIAPYLWASEGAALSDDKLRDDLLQFSFQDFEETFSGLDILAEKSNFRDRLQEVLKKGNLDGDNLIRTYRVQKNLNALAESLVAELVKSNPSVKGNKNLIKNMKAMLKEDLLKETQPYIYTSPYL